jgi:hypothetical protein
VRALLGYRNSTGDCYRNSTGVVQELLQELHRDSTGVTQGLHRSYYRDFTQFSFLLSKAKDLFI